MLAVWGAVCSVHHRGGLKLVLNTRYPVGAGGEFASEDVIFSFMHLLNCFVFFFKFFFIPALHSQSSFPI